MTAEMTAAPQKVWLVINGALVQRIHGCQAP